MQDKGEGLQPLAFLSRRLKPTEQKYSAYECELAAVAYCLQSWRHYLEGCPGGVTVVTDHQPLTHIMDQLVLTRVQTRWMRLGLFQSINPVITYQPGKANVVADALSRSQRTDPRTEYTDIQHRTYLAATAHDEDEVVFMLTATSWKPTSTERTKWTQAYQDDIKLKVAYAQLSHGQPYNDMQLTSTGLLTTTSGGETKIVVPTSLSQQVMKECHDIPAVGHVGVRRTLELVTRQFHWRRLRNDVTAYVKTCPTCQQMKPDHRAKAGLFAAHTYSY